MATQTRGIRVYGRVQGVWFRASTQNKARELAVKGWVRNASDGCVEIHAEGSDASLDEFVLWCRQGPPAAKVSNLKIDSVTLENFSTFEIL